MTHYLLSMYTPADGTPPAPAELDAIMKNVDALQQDLRAAGTWVFSGGLEAPETATVVRAEGGDVLTTDGPFAEAKEYLGGITIIDVPDLDWRSCCSSSRAGRPARRPTAAWCRSPSRTRAAGAETWPRRVVRPSGVACAAGSPVPTRCRRRSRRCTASRRRTGARSSRCTRNEVERAFLDRRRAEL